MGRVLFIYFFADEVGTVVGDNCQSVLSIKLHKQKANSAGRRTDCSMEGLTVLNAKQDSISRSDVMDGKP